MIVYHLKNKKCDSVNDNAHSKLVISKVMPLSPIRLENSHSSSLTISNTHINTEINLI